MKINNFLIIKDDELLENTTKFEKQLKIASEKNKLDSESVQNEEYLKAKRKFYNGKINKNFHNSKIPKEGSKFICLSVVLIDSVFRTGKNYYSQVFLEECKYVVKEKKILKYIIDDIEISSDSDKENSDEESSYKKNSGKENSSEENSSEEKFDEEDFDEES